MWESSGLMSKNMRLPVVFYNVETLTEGIKKGHKECGLLGTSRRRIAWPGYMGERLTSVTHTGSNARDGDHQRLLNVMVWFQTFFFRFT